MLKPLSLKPEHRNVIPILTKNQADLKAEIKKHVETNSLVQGNYWDGSKGCFVGCLAQSENASVIQERFGLPLPLIRICESIFDNLSFDDAKAFFTAFPLAVGRDGKDLSRVHWKFFVSELQALPKTNERAKILINQIISGMVLLSKGKTWDNAFQAAQAAHSFNEATADKVSGYATQAAAYAAYTAYVAYPELAAYQVTKYSAFAAYSSSSSSSDRAEAYANSRKRQRDSILQFITESN